jgi:mitochondrial fission protein ELM1
MSDIAAPWIMCEGLAGLRSQALGLAEAAGLSPEIRELKPAAPWKWIAAKLWPNPLSAVADAVRTPLPALAIGCGGMAGAVLAALRRRQAVPVVQVQNPRMAIDRFDLIIANHHDELTGSNVFVSRTALHRVTPVRLAAEADAWRDRLAPYRRPLVSVLLGGSNGRFRLDRDSGARFAADLATMAQRDKVGIVVTPSRRTDPAVTDLIRTALAPTGGWVWDFEGENPYFGMLALADLIVVTQDSVSMISEAAATTAPVMFAPLPGHWQRQGLFLKPLLDEDRMRPFEGRFSTWNVTPLNDTPEAAAEMRRRLGF